MFVFRKIWRALFFLKHPFWDYPFCLITDELLLMNSLFLKIFAKCVLSTATFTFFGFIICWIKLSLHICFVLLGEESTVLFDSEVIEIDHFFLPSHQMSACFLYSNKSVYSRWLIFWNLGRVFLNRLGWILNQILNEMSNRFSWIGSVDSFDCIFAFWN